MESKCMDFGCVLMSHNTAELDAVVMPLELVVPAEESSSRLSLEAVAEALRVTTGTDHGAGCFISSPAGRADMEAEEGAELAKALADDDKEEGSPFSRVPSAASVQRNLHGETGAIQLHFNFCSI